MYVMSLSPAVCVSSVVFFFFFVSDEIVDITPLTRLQITITLLVLSLFDLLKGFSLQSGQLHYNYGTRGIIIFFSVP